MFPKRKLQDETIQKTFRLAYMLHPDRAVAWCVTKDGLDRAPFLKSLQDKRKDARFPFKMKTPEDALPQVGLYYASDAWERNQEGTEYKREPVYKPTVNDLVARYIKLLVWETMHRDTGNVAVGIGTLLYTYLTSQVSSLAPDFFDDDNIRRDKSRLVVRVRDRFQSLTVTTDRKLPDGEERFLVQHSLRLLAPWVSSHAPPLSQNENLLEMHFRDGLPKLDWKTNHVLVDPECGGFHRLISEYNDQLPKGSIMRLDNPDEKLAIPIFDGKADGQNDRFNPPSLSPTELLSIKESLKKNTLRRKFLSSGRIRVCVDGKERARFWSVAVSCKPFSIPLSASYIEIYGEDDDGELLLAFFPFSSSDSIELRQSQEFQSSAIGGQEIQCVIFPEFGGDGEVASAAVCISYVPKKSGVFNVFDKLLTAYRLSPLSWSLTAILSLLLLTMFVMTIQNKKGSKNSDGETAPSLIMTGSSPPIPSSTASTPPTIHNNLSGHKPSLLARQNDALNTEKLGLEKVKNSLGQEDNYQKLLKLGQEEYLLNASFKIRVDADYKALQRRHSEYAFQINTYKAQDESATFTGDKLKTEDKLYDNPLVQDYVNRLGQSLVPAGSQYRYAFKVILNPIPDARSLSTGTVYVTTGLLSIIDNEAQLSYLLAHEISHIEKRHWFQDALVVNEIQDFRLGQENKQQMIASGLDPQRAIIDSAKISSLRSDIDRELLAGNGPAIVKKFIASTKVFAWDRIQENEADEYGMKLIFNRNYDPREVPKLFARLQYISEREPLTADSFLARADHVSERVSFINPIISGITPKTDLLRGASNLRAKRGASDNGLISPLEAGKAFGSTDNIKEREQAANLRLQNLAILIREKLEKGEIIGSGEEFDSVMADVKRDNAIWAFYNDMFQVALENLREALQIRNNDPYTYYYFGKVLNLTARTRKEKAEAMSAFITACNLDQRGVLPDPWLYRALALIADRNPSQNSEIIDYLKRYVNAYQKRHNNLSPPNMDEIYTYLKDLGEHHWVPQMQ